MPLNALSNGQCGNVAKSGKNHATQTGPNRVPDEGPVSEVNVHIADTALSGVLHADMN
jgi:hypothetical protein